jgi:electron transfer flavoprotein beta subunit
MADFHFVVCLKVVPKSEEIRVDPETLRLEREGARSEINPPDMNTLEMALGLKDLHGGKVSIVSMGPPNFEPFLRIGLAMGADAVYLLSDQAFAGADTLATTYTLAKAITKLGAVDLILCGEESSDGATGQVPPGLAEWLEVPQMTLISKIEFDKNTHRVKGRREIEGGYEILETPMPAVLSVKTASNEPRFMDYEIKEHAMQEAKVTIWNMHDLDTDPDLIGIPGSPTIVTGLGQADTRERKMEFITGNAEEIVNRLTEIMSEYL